MSNLFFILFFSFFSKKRRLLGRFFEKKIYDKEGKGPSKPVETEN
jgi:hypothetical protein